MQCCKAMERSQDMATWLGGFLEKFGEASIGEVSGEGFLLEDDPD